MRDAARWRSFGAVFRKRRSCFCRDLCCDSIYNLAERRQRQSCRGTTTTEVQRCTTCPEFARLLRRRFFRQQLKLRTWRIRAEKLASHFARALAAGNEELVARFQSKGVAQLHFAAFCNHCRLISSHCNPLQSGLQGRRLQARASISQGGRSQSTTPYRD